MLQYFHQTLTTQQAQTNKPTPASSHVPLSVDLALALFLLSVNRGDGGISSPQTASPIRPHD